MSKPILLNGFFQICPSAPSGHVHCERLFPFSALYNSFPARANLSYHPDCLLDLEELYKFSVCFNENILSERHLVAIFTTYRRSILNHIPFSQYLDLYQLAVNQVQQLLTSLSPKYILYADTPHHLEHIVFLSAASVLNIKCFGISGVFSDHTGFIFEIDAQKGVVNLLPSSSISFDLSYKNLPAPISLDNKNPAFDLKDHYGLGEKQQAKQALKERRAKLRNYVAYGTSSREHQQFLLFRHYQSYCTSSYDSLISAPFILFLLHYEPEAVVDHFSCSTKGQISDIVDTCKLLEGRGIRFLVKEHPATFKLGFANGETHVPIFRKLADYDRLSASGLVFVDNSLDYESFIAESNNLCVVSIASTGLYQAQLNLKYIYPLGTTIYSKSNLSLDKTQFQDLPGIPEGLPSSSTMDHYLVPRYSYYSSLNLDDSEASIFVDWLNALDKIISSYI